MLRGEIWIFFFSFGSLSGKLKSQNWQMLSSEQVNCCGALLGVRKRKILCSRESDRVVVSDQRCHGTPRPPVIADPCNTECELRFVSALHCPRRPRPAVSDPTPRSRWHVARKSECTAQCGLGYRTLEIYCAKISHADGKTEKVDDRFCSGHHKPDNKEGCHGDCNPGGWEYSPWSEVGTGGGGDFWGPGMVQTASRC